MDISIIIPVFRVEPYIEACLESVVKQKTKATIECILVDDCSGDRSLDIAKSFIAKYRGKVVFSTYEHERNVGPSGTKNTGIKSATGRYLFFLDSDDYITDDCIDKLWKKALRYPTAQVITGDTETFPEPGQCKWISLKGKNLPNNIEDEIQIRNIWLDVFPIIPCNKLIDREWLISNNLFFKEGIVNEDNYWQYHSYSYIKSVAVCHDVTYMYRMRPGSITDKQKKANEDEIDLYKLQVFAGSIPNITIFDPPMKKYIVGKLMFLRASHYGSAKKIINEMKHNILASKYTSLRLKLASLYVCLPRPIMRYTLIAKISGV